MFTPQFPKNYLTQGIGKTFFVRPVSGNDSDTGTTPQKAFKTLAKAHDMCTANRDDTVYFLSEGNSAANATDYQSSTLTWSKDHTHLIGVNAGQRISHRSRIGFISTYTTASNLMTLSANGCRFENLEMFAGVASANPTGCFYVTGDRNHIVNCHIAGIGNDSMDIAGAYSLRLDSADENYFENCVIGCDTITRGSASFINEIYVGASSDYVCQRNIFKGCYIIGLCGTAANYVFLNIPAAGSISRFILFDNCSFINPGASVGGGASMTTAFKVHASAGGYVLLKDSTICGADDVNAAADTGLILTNSPANQTTDASIMTACVKT